MKVTFEELVQWVVDNPEYHVDMALINKIGVERVLERIEGQMVAREAYMVGMTAVLREHTVVSECLSDFFGDGSYDRLVDQSEVW